MAELNVNQELADTILQHQHYLLAVEQHAIQKMIKPLNVALKEVKTKMAAVGYDPATFTGRRLAALEKQLTGLVETATAMGGETLIDTLGDVIVKENEALTGILRDAIPFPVDTMISLERIPLEHVQQMIQTPLGGATLNGRLKTLVAGAGSDVRSALQTAVILGEGVDAAARRIRDKVKGNTAWKARRIARTEIHRAAAQTHKEMYGKHPDILSGLQFTSTLDDRVCIRCGSLDGSKYYYPPVPTGFPPVSGAPEIPIHANCRCIYLPQTRSWKALGFSKKDLKNFPGLARMDGLQAQTLDYAEWFKGQPTDVQKKILGGKRWAAYKKGKFSFRSASQAVPKNLAPLSPKKLGGLRGLASNAAAKKPALLTGAQFTTAEVRKEMRNAMLRTGLTRAEVTKVWRGMRTAQAAAPGQEAYSISASLLDILEDTRAGIDIDDALAIQRGVINELSTSARALLKEANALAGGTLTTEQMAAYSLTPSKKEYATLMAKYFPSGLPANYNSKLLAAKMEDLVVGQAAKSNGLDLLLRATPTTGKKLSYVTSMTDIGLMDYSPSARGFHSPDLSSFSPYQQTRLGIRSAMPNAKLMESQGQGVVSLSLENLANAPEKYVAGEFLEEVPDVVRVLWHEAGHDLEFKAPHIKEAAEKFLASRTKDYSAITMNSIYGGGYGADEIAKVDKFHKPYAGKIYDRAAGGTEVLSCATEHIPALYNEDYYSTNEDDFLAEAVHSAVSWVAYDPGHFSFLLNALSGTTGF